jgi:hypothetical protein
VRAIREGVAAGEDVAQVADRVGEVFGLGVETAEVTTLADDKPRHIVTRIHEGDEPATLRAPEDWTHAQGGWTHIQIEPRKAPEFFLDTASVERLRETFRLPPHLIHGDWMHRPIESPPDKVLVCGEPMNEAERETFKAERGMLDRVFAGDESPDGDNPDAHAATSPGEPSE